MRYILFASTLCIVYALAMLVTSVQTIHYDPRLAALRTYMAAKYPAPDGCEAVGIWEDGSQVAYCLTDDAWIARGPDTDDSWQPYDGPHAPVWEDCAHD